MQPREQAELAAHEADLWVAQRAVRELVLEQVSCDIDRAVPHYQPGDGRSWWARTRAGEHRPVRLQYFQEHSECVAALLTDRRFLAIAALTNDGHACRKGNAIEALIKPIGVVEGISDVTWHKDCSLGRHSYQCCGITAGVSVTKSGEESGQLCVVAGSHRASLPLKGLRTIWTCRASACQRRPATSPCI